jgi:cell wall-associated NlpC family hydrolase
MAVEDERKQIRAARQQELDQYNQQLATATQLTTFLEAQVVGEFNNVNWEALRIQDPAEYAARRQEFAERAQQVQQAKAYATSQQQRAWQIGQAETMQNHQQYLQQQAELMIQSNPTWQDQATLARDMGSMKEFMSHQYGFTEDDFQVVTDHRMIKVLQDAKAFRDGKEAAKPKLTKTVPKYVKPGQRQAVAGAVGRAVKQKRAALKRSGSIQDAASLLESRM